MTGLRDIAPLSEKVAIRDFELELRGLDVGDIAYLLQRFPTLRKTFGDWTGPDFNAQAVAALGNEIVGVLIACASGGQGDEAEEKGAAALSLGEKLDVIEVIMRLTAPGGVVPFAEKLSRMVAGAAVAEFGRALGTSSQPQLRS